MQVAYFTSELLYLINQIQHHGDCGKTGIEVTLQAIGFTGTGDIITELVMYTLLGAVSVNIVFQ